MKTASSRHLAFVAFASMALFLSGCATTEPTSRVVQDGSPSDNGVFSVIVSPGQGRSCAVSPCSIFLDVPDLGREVEVVVNNFSLGSFPSGQVSGLGQFNDSARIAIRGEDLPMAFVNIPQNRAR